MPAINPWSHVSDNSDCDDSNPEAYPNAPEYCDGIDTNCNAIEDDPSALDAPQWYTDVDGDGLVLLKPLSFSVGNQVVLCPMTVTATTSVIFKTPMPPSPAISRMTIAMGRSMRVSCSTFTLMRTVTAMVMSIKYSGLLGARRCF